MNRLALVVAVASLSIAITGCSAMKRATGQLDDSVLPGQRENVLPPDMQTARDPSVTGGNAAASGSGISNCEPGEPNCIGGSAAEEPPTYQDDAIVAEEPPVEPPVVKKPVKKAPAKKVAAKKPPVKKKPIAKQTMPKVDDVTVPDDPVPIVPDASGETPKL